MPGAHRERCGHTMTHRVCVLVGMLCITPVALSRSLPTAHHSFGIRISQMYLQPCSETFPFQDRRVITATVTLSRKSRVSPLVTASHTQPNTSNEKLIKRTLCIQSSLEAGGGIASLAFDTTIPHGNNGASRRVGAALGKSRYPLRPGRAKFLTSKFPRY
jgi:hypothetical protein